MPSLPPALSPRERDVAVLVARGHTDAEIADRLRLSEHTVGSYLRRIYMKLAIHRRTQLARWAYTHGVAKVSR